MEYIYSSTEWSIKVQLIHTFSQRYNMTKPTLLLLPFIMGLTATTVQAQSPDTRPNIVIILADDLGFTDLKSYGSEIDTPNLDALANEGIRFSNHHVSASCAPTRAMLLTGVDSHRAGVGNIAEAKTESQSGSAFYNGTLNDNVVLRLDFHTKPPPAGADRSDFVLAGSDLAGFARPWPWP